MMSWSVGAFKEKLESEHSFPGQYIFKFIVPLENVDKIKKILPPGEFSERKSSNNKYISVTVKAKVNSSDAVVEVYQRAYGIEGIIAL